MKARHAAIAILSAIAAFFGIVGGLRGVPAKYCLSLATALGDASAVLFGVFGIWLGICYREEMHELLFGKEGDKLVRTAQGLVKTSARCEVLFSGLAISSVIFIASLLLHAVSPFFAECTRISATARVSIKCAFFSVTLVGAVFQIYSIMTPIIIMAEAICRLRTTRKRAEDILRRQKKY